MTPYWLIPVVAVMVWSGVGIVRGALRTITDRHQRWIWRAFAIASVLLVGLAAIALANDICYFVSIWMTD